MFFGSHKMKMSHYFFNLWYPLEHGTLLISEDPPPLILKFSQLKHFWQYVDVESRQSAQKCCNLRFSRTQPLPPPPPNPKK